MFDSLIQWWRGQKPRTIRNTRTRLNVEILEDRTVPTLLGNSLYPADNPWNQFVGNAPVAANSSAIINNIITLDMNDRLHPDFGQNYGTSHDLYGIPYNVVHGNSVAKTSVVIDNYAGESDILPAPIPANVVLENDFQNGPKVGVANRGDSHLLIYDVDNNISYEFFCTSRPSENADGKWHARQETVWDMKTNTFRTLGWTSTDAAGLSVLAGLIRPDEALPVSQGGQGVINHAIRFTLQNNEILDQFIYPASHVANDNNNPAVEPPMGARFRLKASVDISGLNPQARIIAQAMKDYGLILADNGSNFYISGSTSAVNASNQVTLTWNDDDIQDFDHGLKSLFYSDFEVVDLTPVVTDLSVHTGSAGTSVTIVGQNFSGAAGHLSVYFGATAATSVTYVDASHLLVTAPAGTGTVDVRVQSGVTTPAFSQNIKSTIFGYGSSATNANDKFTFGTPPANTAPTVATAAIAAPSVVTGTTTVLSVLGADDGGAANLIYTWSTVSKPTGAADPTFSVNGSNAAKNTTVTFTTSGAYTFRATIRDVQGLTVTSDVAVTVTIPVNAAPAVVTAAGASPSVVTGSSTALSVLGADDGGAANLIYTWSIVSKPTGAADPTFSVNGSNAAKNSTVTFTTSGAYTLRATIRDVQGLTVTSDVAVTVTIPVNTAPTVVTAAGASPSVVTGTTTVLSVLGADDGGAANLIYTWSIVSKPTGAADPTFSVNGSNAAKNTTVTFTTSGAYTLRATIRDVQGLTVTSDVAVTVTIPVVVPNSPSGTITSDMPTFSWGAVTGAVRYAVKVVDAGSGAVVFNQANISGTTWTPSTAQALTPGHSYGWYLGSVNSAGATSYGSGTNFTIAALAAPTQIAPIGAIAATAGYDQPTFTWSAVTGANHYYLYVVDNTSSTTAIDNPNVNGTTYTPSAAKALTPGHSFTWYLGAVSTNGKINSYDSSGKTFTLAALPAPGMVGPGGSVAASNGYDLPTFSWNAVSGADHYYLYVADQTTGKVVINNANVAGTTFSATQPITPGHSVIWYIGAISANGMVNSYVPAGQTVTLAPLPAPTLTGPTGTIAASNGYDMPTFTWSAVAGANHYYLYVVDTTTSQVAINNANVIGTSFTTTAGQALTPGHNFTWYVGAISTDGQVNSYLPSGRSFKLAALPAPALTGPSGTVTSTTPTFSWSSVAGADHYYLYVVDVTSGEVVIDNPNVAGSSLTPSVALKRGHRYIWFVGAISTNGHVNSYLPSGMTFDIA